MSTKANTAGRRSITRPLHYLVDKKLGQGQYGTTYLCTDKATSADYPCKSIPKRKLMCKEDFEDVWREIQTMHQNVVRIQGTYDDSVFVHLVTGVCAGGELFDRIVKTIVHRDLKPGNFLFESSGDDDAKLKATDFGFPYYVAPEVLCKRYGNEVDVWSAGVLLYILLSGIPPFWAETESGIFKQILRGKLDFETQPWPSVSDSAKDLIRNITCLREKETQRSVSQRIQGQ